MHSFIIGSSDDFETEDDLFRYFQNGGGNLNASRFDYDLSDDAPAFLASRIGCGLAFENDWCKDGTVRLTCLTIDLESPGASTLPLDELLIAYAEMHGRHNTRGTEKRIYVNREGKWSVEYSFRGRFGGVEGGFSLVVPTSTRDHTRIEVEYIIRQIVGGE